MALQFRAVRLRIRALTAGVVDDAVCEAVALTKIKELWESCDWSWRQAHSVLTTVAPHSEGSVTLVAPADVQGGVGSNFTTADLGRDLIIGNANARYTVVAVDAGFQRLTLNKPYAGAVFTASPYRLQQSIYPLEPDFGKAFEAVWWHRIVETSLPTMNRYDGRRAFMAQQPLGFRYAGLTSAGVQQVEISPVPSAVLGIYYTYLTAAPTTLGDTTTVPLREDMLVYLTASDAMQLKAIEVAEKNPGAAGIYATQADKYQALGQHCFEEARYQDLQLASPARAVRDEGEDGYYYSDDMAIGHDINSPF